MAGENIVRQDIVQISFDVDNSGLAVLTRNIDSMRNAITGASVSCLRVSSTLPDAGTRRPTLLA